MSAKLGTKADRWKRYRARHKPYKNKSCSTCGVAFQQTSNSQRRCAACRWSVCGMCSKKFLTDDGRKHKFCSRQCKDMSQRGSEPLPLANKRGVKPRTYHLRHRDKHGSAFDREWRIAVFERDNYTCQLCGVRGGRLQADHIKPFKAFPELRHDLSNGRTLCVPCHKTTPTYGWSAYWWAKRLAQEVLQL